MENELKGKRVAILVTNGFERSELTEPLRTLRNEGADVDVVSLKKDAVKSWNHKEWGDDFKVDRHIDEADAKSYDALVLPGGVMNPDMLRMDLRAVAFVRSLADDGKLVAAICHGPWTLVEADVVRGRKLTSFPSLRTDLVNAGAEWVDEEVVVDENFVTSRRPEDLPAFCATVVSVLAGRSAPETGIGAPAGPGE
jgi:protease I